MPENSNGRVPRLAGKAYHLSHPTPAEVGNTSNSDTMGGIPTALRLIAEERERKSGLLDLGNLQLAELPTSLFELSHLRFLNLGIGYRDQQGRYQKSANGNYATRNALRALHTVFVELGKLEILSLQGNPINDLAPLKALTALQTLQCSDTQVSNLAPLRALTALQTLNCNSTPVSNLAPLEALTALHRLDCSFTQVRSLAPLKALTSLQHVHFAWTQNTRLSSDCSYRPVAENGSSKHPTYWKRRTSYT